MPIIATVAANPAPVCCTETPTLANLAAVPGGGVNILSATATTKNGRVLLTRMRSVRLTGKQQATLEWQLHDQQGSPVDLQPLFPESSESSESSEGVGYTIALRLQEHLSAGAVCPRATQYAAEIVDATTGKVSVTFPKEASIIPGIYFGEMAVLGTDPADSEPFVLFANTFYVIVERGMWSGKSRRGAQGPPLFAEIRMHLRDSDAAESYLLDNVKFDDAEIALATVRPVQEWNETPPPVGTYTTQNFPFRYYWLEAICGNLFLMAAEQFRANNLQYNAGGVAVNDQDKEPNYERAAQLRLQGWRTWMRAKKVEINMGMAYGGIGSTYGRLWGAL